MHRCPKRHGEKGREERVMQTGECFVAGKCDGAEVEENNTCSGVVRRAGERRRGTFKTADEKQEGQTKSQSEGAPVSISLRPLK